MTMEIAAMSMAMSEASVQQQVNVSLLDKSMDNQAASAEKLLDMMPQKTPPARYGSKLDLYI